MSGNTLQPGDAIRSLPREKYLSFWEDAFNSDEVGVPEKNASVDELKKWELNRVKKLISVNAERQKAKTIIYSLFVFL